MINEKVIESVKKKHTDLSLKIQDKNIFNHPKKYAQLSKDFSDTEILYKNILLYEDLIKRKNDSETLIKTEKDEMKEMAKEEYEEVKNELIELENKINRILLPKDENDDKNVIVEIRAGTGGDESALFAADLFRMYSRYAEEKNWKIEVYSCNETGLDGFKEIIFSVNGKHAYARLKFESGAHRVQRIPLTESGGRVHTSAATVSVLPEADDIEIDIKPEDLKIDTYKASGAGGQHVNTTDSAVRITHIPTGVIVGCQDERSQHKNKAKALKLLKTKLYDIQTRNIEKKQADLRKIQVGTGDRSEKIRTYNFPQNRITDHRVNLTLYKLNQILSGQMDEMINFLIEENEKRRLNALSPPKN